MMEFEDQDEEHEEQEEEEEEGGGGGGGGGGGVSITGYGALAPNSSDRRIDNEARSSSSSPPPSPLSLSIPPALTRRKPAVRYRECLKNHAVGIGGHAVDGCGEFLPAGEEGSIDALKCAACNCHRNFHRKEVDLTAQSRNHSIVQSHQIHHHQAALTPISYYPNHQQPQPVFQFHPYRQPRPLALPSTSGGGDQERETTISNPMAAMGLGSSGKKRHRTKFTGEQKEKMMELAERIGWRLQKQNEGLVQQFCHETGLNRHVLKVWLHNNKHTLGKKP